MIRAPGLALAATIFAACGGGNSAADAGGPDATATPAPSSDWSRDILSTDLSVAVDTRQATATIRLAGAQSTGASFEVGDLSITSVRSGGVDLLYSVSAAQLDVGVPASDEPVELVIDYGYQFHNGFEGVMSSGVTLTWPYYCGNMFPCKSDPSDGLRFTMTLSGLANGEVAVYPTAIPGDAPSYMLAWAIGDYTYLDLGATDAGTQVGAWYLPGEMVATESGTTNLRGVIDWLEKTYGSYIFGDEVAAVSARWGFGAYGGMEHHPFWHTASGAMSDEETQAHEAAHGWFGNGIRIACWEDFVLSEGMASYLAARSLGAVAGVTTEAAIWADYQNRLDALLNDSAENQIAWPDSCGQIDVLVDGLFNDAPYMKGAFFFRALELKVTTQALDAALAVFYDQYKGKAARMQDLLDVVKAETGYDPQACALAWLRSATRPVSDMCE